MKTFLNRVKSMTGTIILFIILILLIAVLPSLFSYGRASNEQYYSNIDDPDFIEKKHYKLHFHAENIWRKPLFYFKQLKSGGVFTYEEGKTVRSFLEEAPRYFSVSFFYASLAGMISLTAGILLSLRMSDKRNNPIYYEFLSFMTVFPDFILILIIQFIFFNINRITGLTVLRLYTPSASDRAVFLPLLVLSIYPCLYIIRTIGTQLKDLNTETFINMAHAKGLSQRAVRYFHLGPAAVSFIKGDIHKLLAIIFSNLFITELMFNNKGLTSFLFNNIQEYDATVNTIILILILYLIIHLVLQALLFIIGIVFRRSLP